MHDKYWTDYATQIVNKVEDYVKTFQYCSGFHLPIKKIDWNPKRKVSKGGHYFYDGNYYPGISIAMLPLFCAGRHYREYAAYREDPEVGEFWSLDPKLHIKATICHEISHAIQAFLDADVLHDDLFLYYFRKLRGKFVNNSLDFANLLQAA